jgi:serine/threonine-protein kinase
LQVGITGYDESLPTLEAAIARDPLFAPAYAGIATAHAERSGEFRFNFSDERTKMWTASKKALELDPMLAEAQEAIGLAYTRDAQWQQSEKSFRKAIEIEPGSAEIRRHFAMFLLWPLGRLDEALTQLRIAEESDPLSVPVHIGLFNVLLARGSFDEAAAECAMMPEKSGGSECLGRVRIGQGKIDQAIQILARTLNKGLPAGHEVRGYLGFAFGLAGRRQEAEQLEAETRWLNPFNHALIFAGLKNKERTLEALERAIPGGPFRMGRALLNPELSLLRSDPRLKALRQTVGLPN